jgi:hypothetical protein
VAVTATASLALLAMSAFLASVTDWWWPPNSVAATAGPWVLLLIGWMGLNTERLDQLAWFRGTAWLFYVVLFAPVAFAGIATVGAIVATVRELARIAFGV